MKAKISVIVPVYNVEKYLKKCIESIINQTYKNLEIILVDDGSPDKCGDICDQYASNDNRIKVIHKKNGGLSDARNAGLDISTGEFITFVDSDDTISFDLYEKEIKIMNECGCDIVETSVTSVYLDKCLVPDYKETEIIDGAEAMTRYLKSDGNKIPRTAVWSKLFRRKIWGDLRFPVGKIHEDYMLTVITFKRCNKYGIIYEGLYHHLYDNPTSIVNSKFSKKDLFRAEQLKNVKKFVSSNGNSKQYEYAAANYYTAVIQYFYKCSFAGFEESQRFRKILFQEKADIRKSALPKKKKVEIFMIKFFPRLYLIGRKIVTFKKRKLK